MYKCHRCGAKFDEPDFDTWREWHSEVDAWEDWAAEICPECGSKNIEEVFSDDEEEEEE